MKCHIKKNILFSLLLTLISLLSFLSDTAFGIGAAGPSTVYPGQKISFSVSGDGVTSSGWVGFYKAGSADTGYISYANISSLTGGVYTVIAPMEPGTYNFRVFKDKEYTKILTSDSVQVIQYTPLLALKKTNFIPNEEITVSYSEKPVFSSAWIGFYKADATDQGYRSFAHLSVNPTGSYTVIAPQEPGQYQFRMFLDSGYTKVGASPIITVGDFAPIITTSVTSAKPGDKITANYTNGPTNTNAWIGFYKSGAPDTGFTAWAHTGGKATGSYEVTLPSQAGTYEFRIFKDGDYIKLSTSMPVSAGTDTDGADDPLVIGKDPFAKPSKTPRVYVGDSNPGERWEEAKRSLPAIFTLEEWEAKCFRGIIRIAVKQKTSLYISPGNGVAPDSRKPLGYFNPDEISEFYADPAGVLSAVKVAKTEITITGLVGGMGKIFVATRGSIAGHPAKCFSCWMVIVTEYKDKPDPTSEIPQVDFSGRAILKKDGSPAAGASITLTLLGKSDEILGTYLTNEDFKTNPDGSFRVRATGLPRGRFEIMIQLLGQTPDSAKERNPPKDRGVPGLWNENDLWPFRQHVIDLTPELAKQGLLDVGDIILDYVKVIDFANRPVKVLIPKTDPGIQPDVEADLEEPEIAFSTASGIIFQSYNNVWEDTQRAYHQLPFNPPPLAPDIIFKDNPQSSAAFTINKRHTITKISTFHWYGGSGANPGAIEISKMDGRYAKSWPARGEKDFSGSRTVYWVIEPNEELAPGTYYVNTSPPNAWSFNRRSQLKGILKVEGYEVISDGEKEPPPTDPCSKPISRNLTISPGKTAAGKIEAKAQSDFYKVAVAAGQSVIVSIQAEPRLFVRADLLDPGQKRRGRKTGRMSPGPATFEYKAATAGEYTIRVWVKNGQCKTGSYTVGVTLK